MQLRIEDARHREDEVGSDCAPSLAVANPLELEDWNLRLRTFPSATVFHTREWAAVLKNTYSHRPHYLRESTPSSAPFLLPVMESASWIKGQRGISLPFSDECAALHSGLSATNDLLGAVRKIPASSRWRSWEYRGGAAQRGAAPFAQSYFGHKLEIQGASESIFAQFDGTVRTSLRKARQLEVTASTFTNFGAMQIFHGQLCETRRRHGLPPQPLRFFEEIQRNVVAGDLGFIVVAVHRGNPVATAVFLHFGETAIYKFAASDFRYRDLQANHYALWHGIEECRRRGCRALDLGRTSRSNLGLRHFKLAWRPQERSIDYVKYDFRRSCYVERERDLTVGWHNRLFRMLPLPISKAIGALAYRHTA